MKTFTLHVAMNVRAYGYVNVRAKDIDAAKKLATPDLIVKEFSPHGHGDDDFDWINPAQITLTDWTDDEGGEGSLYHEVGEP